MFQTSPTEANKIISEAERGYVIQKSDLLELEVFSNGGEKIVDPADALPKESTQQARIRHYLVTDSGTVTFPLIKQVKIEGLTIGEAERLLEEEYATFYTNPFVLLKYANKRVVVLGSVGGHVIPLTNERMRLTEVLALSKGITNEGKAHNVRVLRGNDVFIADLSTVDGYRKTNMIIEPNDIIYIEPVRRPVIESLRDYSPLLSILTSVATLIYIITTNNN